MGVTPQRIMVRVLALRLGVEENPRAGTLEEPDKYSAPGQGLG